jgi:hypothetical protein
MTMLEMQLKLSKHLFFLLGMYLCRRILEIIYSVSSATKPQWPISEKSLELLKEHNPNVSNVNRSEMSIVAR